MTPTSDAFDTLGPDAAEIGRYGSFESGDDVVVYDRENEDAWLQSDGWVEPTEWR